MPEMTLLDAIREAIAFEMARDNSVVTYGLDVGTNGGVFRVTDGLLKKFGKDRVIDMPLAENTLSGFAVGMAMQGLKPIVEFQFSGFIYAGIDQIINEAARIRNRSRGRLSCPIVYRAPYGGGIHAPEHHSESPEAVLAHIPGLRVVIPSSPARAYGLLLAAIRNPDPVVFLEPKRVYRAMKQEVPNDGNVLPLDRCFLLREGSDITLISWGALLKETLEAADKLSEQNIHVDVIDVATIKPLDIDTITRSVEKTGRCLIVQEAPKTCGFASEIMAQLVENTFYFLKTPIQRLTGFDTIMPYYKLENYYLPRVQDIIKTAHNMMECS